MIIIKLVNYIFITIFIFSYIYQLIVMYFVKEKNYRKYKKHKFAILIAARNEEKVIGNLIDSIKLQEYPKELIDIFVVADNCTDSTAYIARRKETIVFERYNEEEIGKGYALDYLINKIKNEYKNNKYDAFIVFDADNLVDKNFIYEMNRIYSNGYEVVTSFRNSKNYGDNWLSAGSSIFFLHSSLYSKYKMLRNNSSSISGTGFLFSNKVLEFYGGWKFYSLVEDIEFTLNNMKNNIKIGYSDLSILYDEQPTKFSQFWKQRVRWTKGNIDVINKFKRQNKQNRIKIKINTPNTITLSTILTTINLISILILITLSLINIGNESSGTYLQVIMELLISSYIVLEINSIITTIVEWNKIKVSWVKKIIYIFTFPFMILCYIPIPFICLFKNNINWEQIKHNNTKNIEMMR